jgi:two-component system, NtrC family, response regulator AtoC
MNKVVQFSPLFRCVPHQPGACCTGLKRALLTWSDAGTVGPKPAHHAPRPTADRGPVLRLLDQSESRYDAVWILTIPAGESPARALADDIRETGVVPSIRVIDVVDPSDYAALFGALGPVAADVRRAFPSPEWSTDILLSAGTPQAQTLWVILVQAGILSARMLQVIPAIFVGPERPPIRHVRLDIDGFPEIRALRREVHRLREQVRPKKSPIIGESPPIVELRSRIARIAASDAPLLVLGETGTGKELVARAIHDQSARAKGPFVAENCGVFAEGVLASELFGHEAGAFTGATARRKGVFEQAHTGTLLLDEVGELSPRVQAALLRVLQEGALRRVGGESKVAVDVRIVAATHKDLARMVREGTFREDLYFRLRGATIDVPPLRSRPGDIELLVGAFLDEIAGRRAALRLTVAREAMRAVSAYPWPGNVRELKAEVERWAVFCDGLVEERDLAPELREGRAPTPGRAPTERPGQGGTAADIAPLIEVTERAERDAIEAALSATAHNLSATARGLRIDRNTLKRKMAVYRIGRG